MTEDNPSSIENPAVELRQPRVFISHDSRDAEFAAAFDNLLCDCSGGCVQSFRSSDREGEAGIPFGDDWFKWIMDKLDESTDVVALLTPRSLHRQWILYEVGVAKGKLGKVVYSVVAGMPLSAVSDGPFHRWQNCECAEKPLVKLARDLVTRNGVANPRPEAIRKHVQEFLDVVKGLEFGGTEEREEPVPTDSAVAARYFEDIKLMIRQLTTEVGRLNVSLPALEPIAARQSGTARLISRLECRRCSGQGKVQQYGVDVCCPDCHGHGLRPAS